MLNKLIAEGNLTRDPETSKINGKYTVCKFGIAINNPYREDSPTYIEVETWNKLAENCEKFLEKGRKVIVEGRLDLKRWETEGGEKRNRHFCAAERVHFSSGEQNKEKAETSSGESTTEAQTSSAEESDDMADIPF
ncbi:MAG: single-stranded DNA-binding protein [Actinobacteria bacterium]|nr:single-stranded DNA-binding protein [Actinomycetota bacterium]|tara:strand:+ start:292 stop:699 length:408 start_codon:yes stop_codon:yes gene_type:complete